MFDFFLVYPIAFVLALGLSVAAPALPPRTVLSRIGLGILAGGLSVALAAIVYAALSRATWPTMLGFTLLATVWGAMLGTLGGIMGAGVRRFVLRR